MPTLYASYNERDCSILKKGSRVPVLFSVLQFDNAYRTTCYKSTLRDIMMGIKALWSGSLAKLSLHRLIANIISKFMILLFAI